MAQKEPILVILAAGMGSRFGGSFPPMLRFEPREIHKVFLRASNLAFAKNLSANLLAKLCSVAVCFFACLC